MKGHNLCTWMKIGETVFCGKSCCGTYCKVHLARIHRDCRIPVPCRSRLDSAQTQSLGKVGWAADSACVGAAFCSPNSHLESWFVRNMPTGAASCSPNSNLERCFVRNIHAGAASYSPNSNQRVCLHVIYLPAQLLAARIILL